MKKIQNHIGFKECIAIKVHGGHAQSFATLKDKGIGPVRQHQGNRDCRIPFKVCNNIFHIGTGTRGKKNNLLHYSYSRANKCNPMLVKTVIYSTFYRQIVYLTQSFLFLRTFKYKNQYTMSDIASRVKAIIVDKLGVDENEVVPEASFTNDLGADSLDTVELIMEFEKEFDIQIPDDQAENIATVGQAISYIEEAK